MATSGDHNLAVDRWARERPGHHHLNERELSIGQAEALARALLDLVELHRSMGGVA